MNDAPTYAMLADMRDRAMIAERELCAMTEQRDRLEERLNHAETLLSDLAGGYWRSVLNDLDPNGDGVMGEWVSQYWVIYSENTITAKP
jgi:hypothetical protein